MPTVQDMIDMLSSYGDRNAPFKFELDGDEYHQVRLRMCWKHESFPNDIERVMTEDTVICSLQRTK